MRLGRRIASERASTSKVAVDATAYWDFQPGDRVMTVDGFPGVVTEVQSGPIGGAEVYTVVLDNGVGGGDYSASDLTAETNRSAAHSKDAVEQHTASDDYPELAEVLVERPPPSTVTPVTAASILTAAAREVHDEMETPVGIQATAGPLDWAARTFISDEYADRPEGNWSYDWCRFRKNSRCYYPKELNYEATRKEGYAVWVPFDRGLCPRGTWEKQKECSLAEPGPHSGEENALLDATIPYEEGGQRGGVPTVATLSADSLSEGYHGMICPACRGEGQGGPFSLPQKSGQCGKCFGEGNVDARKLATQLGLPSPTDIEADLLVTAAASPSFHFHFTASWSDVRRKAKRIRSEGGVRILSNTGSYITAEVKGDHGVYETTLMREPGTQREAMWECGCAWASYSWGRSGRWKRYEGRKCSHALALSYEAQSQEWGGGTVVEQVEEPEWSRGVKPTFHERERPRPWRIDASLHKVALPPIDPDPTLDQIVDWHATNAQRLDSKVTRDMTQLAEANLGEMEGLNFRLKDRSSIHRKVKERLGRGGDPRDLIKDALRYTIVLHPSVYSAQVRDVLYGLEERGYKIVEGENTWPRGDTYSALHFTLLAPGPDGIYIELQFHTSESYKLKDETLHALYKEFRDSRTPLPRRQELFDVMTAYWDDVDIPDDALAWPGEKKYLRPAAHLLQPLSAHIRQAWRGSEVFGKWRDRLVQLLALLPGGMVRIQGNEVVPASEILHPKWDPREGLIVTSATASLQVEAYRWHDGSDVTLDDLVEIATEAGIPESKINGMVTSKSWGIAYSNLSSALSKHLHKMWARGELALGATWPPYEDPVQVERDRAESLEYAQTIRSTPVAAVLHDEPEPALPEALGSEDDEDDDTASKQAGRDEYPETVYRGVNVALTDGAARDFLESVVRGGLRAAADIVIEAMASGTGIDSWTGEANKPRSGAGPWWSTNESDARLYSNGTSIDGEAKVQLNVAVIMQATFGPEMPDGHTWPTGDIHWKLDEGTALTIDTFKVAIPTNARQILDLLKRQGQWMDPGGWLDPTTFEWGEVTSWVWTKLPIPRMLTQADLRNLKPEAPDAESRSWLMGGTSDKDTADIASAATEFLATGSIRSTGAKVFSPAEQQEIISEGEGVTAANLGSLDIAGTHYESLDALEDDDLLW